MWVRRDTKLLGELEDGFALNCQFNAENLFLVKEGTKPKDNDNGRYETAILKFEGGFFSYNTSENIPDCAKDKNNQANYYYGFMLVGVPSGRTPFLPMPSTQNGVLSGNPDIDGEERARIGW